MSLKKVMKLINSYKANRNWLKANALMGNQFQSMALLSIRKAVELEPDISKIPKYLELQSNIELSIGRSDRAMQSFLKAVEVLKQNVTLLEQTEYKDIGKRIKASIEEIKREKT